MPEHPAPPLDADGLRLAADIYLGIAYPAGPPPETVRRRLEWSAADLPALVAGPPFERASKPGTPPVHALRLGNASYPHMKLQVQPWECAAGYMLSVNTHDQVLGLGDDLPDSGAFRALQAENARLKEAIETAWDEAGLPTFLRYLREYLEVQAAAGASTPS